mgnify:CR=1 FL=1
MSAAFARASTGRPQWETSPGVYQIQRRVENETMDFRLSMDLDVRVTSAYVTYGVSDRIDVGLVLPIVQAEFRGESFAQIEPSVRSSVPSRSIATRPTGSADSGRSSRS